MGFLSFLTSVASRIPIERVLFPPQDKIKALEEFVTTSSAPESTKPETSEQKMGNPTGDPPKSPPELAPLPTDPQTAGKSIAEELGIRYDGVQPDIGMPFTMQFTDVAQTGSTFHANTLAEARTGLEDMRAKFEAAKTPQTPTEEVATACVPCALGHFSTTAGLLNEAVRFKKDGMVSNEILDRIAKCLQEQNALERVDLTPEKILSAPDWERGLVDQALQQSRNLRHRLETIETIEELEQAAADASEYYKKLHREWWQLRLAKLPKPEPEMSMEEAKALAAQTAAQEVEARWHSQEENTPQE